MNEQASLRCTCGAGRYSHPGRDCVEQTTPRECGCETARQTGTCGRIEWLCDEDRTSPRTVAEVAEVVEDVLSGWTIGSGYYETSVATEATAMAAAVAERVVALFGRRRPARADRMPNPGGAR